MAVVSLAVCTTVRTEAAEADSSGSLAGHYIPAGYNLVWSDEFSGNDIDLNKWTPMTWHYSGLEYMSADANHLYQRDGALHLVTTKDGDSIIRPAALSTYRKGDLWTDSNVKEAFKYGYAEIRMRAKLNDGSWPAFWMESSTKLPDRLEHDWYAETDIMEACGKNLGCGNGYSMSSKIKWAPGYSPNRYHYASQGQFSVNTTDGADGKDWVVYGFLWTPETMETYVNGRLTSKISLLDEDAFDAKLTVGDRAKYAGMQGFRDPAYLIISGGAAKTSASNFNKSKLPFDTAVDYIRVYQKPGEGSVYAAPRIMSNSLNNGRVGLTYDSTIEVATRPVQSNEFAIVSGKLPVGLKLDEKTGRISGKPTVAGKYVFVVRSTNKQFTDSDEYSDKEFMIQIVDADKPIPGVDGNNSQTSSASAGGNKTPGAPNAGVVGQMNAEILAIASVAIATGSVIYRIRTRRKRNNK